MKCLEFYRVFKKILRDRIKGIKVHDVKAGKQKPIQKKDMIRLRATKMSKRNQNENANSKGPSFDPKSGNNPLSRREIRRRARLTDPDDKDKKFDFEKWFRRFEKRHLETVEKEKYEKCLKFLLYVFGKKKKKRVTFKQIAKIQRTTIALNIKAQRKKRLNFLNVSRQLRKVVRVQLAFASAKWKLIKSKMKFRNILNTIKFLRTLGVQGKPKGAKVAAHTTEATVKTTGPTRVVKETKKEITRKESEMSTTGKVTATTAQEEIVIEQVKEIVEIEEQEKEKPMSFLKVMSMRRMYIKWKKYAKLHKECVLKRSEQVRTKQLSIMNDLNTLNTTIKELKTIQVQMEVEINELVPSFNDALLQTELPKFNQNNFKALRFNPPISVQMLFSGICVLKGLEPVYIINGGKRTQILAYDFKYASQKMIIKNLRRSLNELRDPKNLHEENFVKYRKFIFPHPEYEKSKIEKSFPDCAFLFDWIEKLEIFAKIAFQIKERHEAIKYIKEMDQKIKISVHYMRDQLYDVTYSYLQL